MSHAEPRLCEQQRRSPLRILCLGSHSDDLEIGCGGTLLKLIGATRSVSVHWIVFSATRAAGGRGADQRGEVPGRSGRDSRSRCKDFRDGFFPYVGYDIKQFFEGSEAAVLAGPDLHPLSRRSASGSPADLGSDVEYVPGPPDSGVRDSQVRWRSRLAERASCIWTRPPVGARSSGSSSCSRHSRIATGSPTTPSSRCCD